MGKNRSRRSGFSLLETLVALAIGSICVAMTLALATTLARSETERARHAMVEEFALSVFETYRVQGDAIGDRGEMPGGWVWSLAAAPEADPDDAAKRLGLASLRVKVTAFNRAWPDIKITEQEIVARAYRDVFP